MLRTDFTYDLPSELIAQRPPEKRGDSRLMRLDRDGPPEIVPFGRFVEAFAGNEILVLNDTRVVPARVRGHKTSGGGVEMLFVERLEPVDGSTRVTAMLRGKRLRPGTEIAIGGTTARIERRDPDGTAELTLDGVTDLWPWLEAHGRVPLPPYIRRVPDEGDRDRYQTAFAQQPGAVAAPTAGLHLTDETLAELVRAGVEVCTLTLHVGLGTFLPVRDTDLSAHHMHAERFEIPARTAEILRSGRPIVAVGTTVVRALETFVRDPSCTRTDLFILPGFRFRLVDGLLTNFHLPESTLLMLVSAFAGRQRVLAAYAQAVRAHMRFYSYGDAMLLRRCDGRWGGR